MPGIRVLCWMTVVAATALLALPEQDGVLLAAQTVSSTTTVLSSSLNPSFVDQSVTFTATVSSQAGHVPNGETVEFDDLSTTPAAVLGSATLSRGGATFATTALSRGSHLIQAVYAGDAQFSSSTSQAITQTVSRYSTSTSLVANRNPAIVGESVRLTATVSTAPGVSTDGELVSFSIDGSVAGTVGLTGGQAVFATNIAEAGQHSITASYPGDVINRVSSSTALSLLVNRSATITTLTASPSPSTPGQAVTLSATITGLYGGTPTGTVTFMNGTSPIGTVTENGGQATLTKAFWSSGVRILSAAYSGDVNYTSSTGPGTQIVNPGVPCTAPCFTSSTIGYGGYTRYWGAYFPANLPASFPVIAVLPGVLDAPYNDSLAAGSASQLFIGYAALVTFANANNVAVLWIMPTAYNYSSNNWTPPFSQCLSSVCNNSSAWLWQLPWYFTNTGGSPADLFSYDASDPQYVHSMVTLAAAWGAGTMIAVGSSTGGLFLNSYAQQFPNDFEAIGLFAGPLWAQNNNASNAPPFTMGSNVNVFYVHGDADIILPYCGGLTSQPWPGLANIASAGADETFNYWANGMSCSTISTPLSLCTSGAPTPNLYSKVATGCSGGKSVQFGDIHNGRHKDAAAVSSSLLTSFWNFAFPQNPAH